MDHIGSIIKRFRQRKGITQGELADACGWGTDDNMGQRRISNYERTLREPKVSELEIIAKALGVSIADFFADPECEGQVALSVEEYRAGVDSLTDSELAELLRITADRLSS